jgi:Spy/CpxP family protein refolding chaperone
VAFLNGTAAVGHRAEPRWWLDQEVRDHLDLTADQVQALDGIYAESEGQDDTQTLWRMYQTLSPEQRRQFSQLLEPAKAKRP